MIQSLSDYRHYLKTDKEALHLFEPQGYSKYLVRLFGQEIWKFIRTLRKTEYYLNCKHSKLDRIYLMYLSYRLHKLGLMLGFAIQPNSFGPGLCLAHPGTIIVDGAARIGGNCSIHPDVVIGVQAGGNEAPTIGNNVYIGPGAEIFGSITIADDIAIGANAVVNKSFTEKGITIGGIPARKISNKGSKGLLTVSGASDY